MQTAYDTARLCLPEYSSRFSRHDYTLGQLFACLVVKELLHRSYRQAEALLRDCQPWRQDIGLTQTPDHNTLWRAADLLLRRYRTNRLLDVMVRWAQRAKLLGLAKKPLSLDSSCYEARRVSRHYEHRCGQSRSRSHGNAARRRTVKSLPKLALSVAGQCHLVLSLWTGTGGGSDVRLWGPLLRQARRRIGPGRCIGVGDAGFDAEENHRLARQDLAVRSIIPLRPPRRPGQRPGGHWRLHMYHRFARGADARHYGQRWQIETVHSMMKRNLGSALRGRTAHSRKRDLALKTLTHNVMIL